MRAAAMPPARVEQVIGYLRVSGIVIGIAAIVIADFPDQARVALIWSTQTVLVVGTATLWLWRRRAPDSRRLLHVGLALDFVVIAGYVLAFAHITPGVAWAMAFTVLADAAMRYGVPGVVLGWVLAMALFVAHGELRAATLDRAFGWMAILYVGGSLVALAGVLAVFSHVVEQQTAVARDQARRLANVQRLRERLVEASSHELRGSITAMVLGIDTVRGNVERLGPERVRAILADVLQQTAHLQRLVDDLSAVTEAHHHDIDLQETRADLADTVDVAVAAAARHHNGHELTVDVPHLMCELDHARLQQVVRNLVENGLKYTPADGRVSVRAEHVGDTLELRVADTGPGIPAADRERIFEPYERRAAEHAEVAGMGLGLYLVRRIVAAMRGTVELSASASGAEFVVRVPVGRRPGSHRAAVAPSAEPQG